MLYTAEVESAGGFKMSRDRDYAYIVNLKQRGSGAYGQYSERNSISPCKEPISSQFILYYGRIIVDTLNTLKVLRTEWSTAHRENPVTGT